MSTARKLREEGKIEVAKNMLENGAELDFVVKATGLSRQQLKEAGIVK